MIDIMDPSTRFPVLRRVGRYGTGLEHIPLRPNEIDLDGRLRRSGYERLTAIGHAFLKEMPTAVRCAVIYCGPHRHTTISRSGVEGAIDTFPADLGPE